MNGLRFRSRLFLVLSLFALLPAIALTLIWGGTVSSALPLVSGSTAWDSVAATGERALSAARGARLTAAQRRALDAHEQELTSSLENARRFQYLASRTTRVIVMAALVALLILMLIASHVAGHLSRQLSRPIDELVGWTEAIARGEPLPPGAPRRGAPEFEMLRERMRWLSSELQLGRERALEAERLRAFRESARQVAHELKNPLTPIRFAIERLRRDAGPELAETVEVLNVEARRLDRMARDFAQFGKLPEGPPSDVDLAELANYTAKATVPPHVRLTMDVTEGLPMVRGHHDALARALSNVLINAVEACGDTGEVTVRVAAARMETGPGIEIRVRDTGCGIPAEKLARIWEPYVTHKAGGTGLGLAIARQAVLAHDGQVAAESRVGEGTEIRFVIPATGLAGRGDEGGGNGRRPHNEGG